LRNPRVGAEPCAPPVVHRHAGICGLVSELLTIRQLGRSFRTAAAIFGFSYENSGKDAGSSYAVRLLVLRLWVSLKWRGTTGIVDDFLHCGRHQLRAMDLDPVGASFCNNPFTSW